MTVDTEHLDPRFNAAISALIAASGGAITIQSAYRSPEEQQGLWNAAVAKYGEAGASKWVARPGHSNHGRGIAVDLGGDVALAHDLAPRFGLVFPMSWEPWHIEPVGARDTAHPDAYTDAPPGEQNPVFNDALGQTAEFQAASLASAMQGASIEDAMQGASSAATSGVAPLENAPVGQGAPEPLANATGGAQLTPMDGSLEDRFLAFTRQHESGGNYKSPSGPGHWAGGAYQVMRDTWNNYGGFARADLAPPEVQDAFARQHLAGIRSALGTDDPGLWAAAWYLGVGGAKQWINSGMNPNFAPPENHGFKVSTYAQQARKAVGA